MIHVDTSVVIAALCGAKMLAPALLRSVARGEKFAISTLVLYEWRRGPRTAEELDAQELVFPSDAAVEFGGDEARVAADLYRRVGRARTRTVDLAIAACAITHAAPLWTTNLKDFADVPELSLHRER
jgi:predicted nucleic acid-binding protein